MAKLLPFMALLFVLPFPGTVTLRLLCLAGALLVAIALWRRLAPPPVPCKPALAFWALVALLSLAGAVDPGYSLGEIKNEVLYTMVAFVAFYAVTREENDLKRLSIALFAGALVMCAWALESRFRLGFWQERGGIFGTEAFPGYAGVLGIGQERKGIYGTGAFPGYAAVLVPVLFLFGAWIPGRWRSMAAAALFAMVAVTGFLSLQRIFEAVLALQVGLALILLWRKDLIRLSRTAVLGGLIGIIVLAGGIFAFVQHERLNMTNATPIAEDARITQWRGVLGRIAQNPVSGSGFGQEIMKKAHRDLIPNSSLWHAHNVFLNYGLEMGLPGILAIGWVFFSLLKEYWRFYNSADEKLRLLGVAGLMLVLGVVLRNQVNDMFIRDAAILFWAINGALLGLGHRRSRQER
jgi:putative inorganic carbon (HCO3(-)) transporter